MDNKIKVATVSMKVEFNTEKNIEKYLSFISEAATYNSTIVVFPEQSIQGYLDHIGKIRPETYEYQHAHAEAVPGGYTTQLMIKQAQEHNLYIIWGMTEKPTDERPDILYNTAVIVGPNGYLGKYRKVHLPLDEVHIYTPGNEWPVFDVQNTKVGIMICYDKNFPESSRELALQGAEILVIVQSWPLIKRSNDSKTMSWDALSELYERVRALENQCYVISSNTWGRADGSAHDFCGDSRIISPAGEIMASTGYAEGIVYAAFDVKEGIVRGRTVDPLGLNVFRDRKPSTYINFHCNNGKY